MNVIKVKLLEIIDNNTTNFFVKLFYPYVFFYLEICQNIINNNIKLRKELM